MKPALTLLIALSVLVSAPAFAEKRSQRFLLHLSECNLNNRFVGTWVDDVSFQRGRKLISQGVRYDYKTEECVATVNLEDIAQAQ